MRRLAARLGQVSLLLVLLTLCLWSTAASAHASLIASTPASDALVEKTPEQVELRFNEPIAPLRLTLIRPDGQQQEMEETKAKGKTLTSHFPALDQQGTYALSWRVTSADGHPVGGTLTFSLGKSSRNPAADSATPWWRNGLIWLFRVAWLSGLVAGIGPVVIQAMRPAQRPAGPASRGLLWLGLGAGVMSLGLLGVDALASPLTGVFSAHVWQTALSTSFATTVLLTTLAGGCALLVRRLQAAYLKRLAALLALVLAAAGLAASGHASTAPPSWLARPAVWLHGIAIMAWLGALWPLRRSLGKAGQVDLLDLFSRCIPAVLVVLVASGGLLTVLQFDRVAELWQTAYGRIFALKLMLVAILLGLGVYNRYRLTQPAKVDKPHARYRLRRIIVIECFVAFSILASVSLWRFTPPPRALDAEQQAPTQRETRVTKEGISARLTLTSHTPDSNGVATVSLEQEDGEPMAAQVVDIVFYHDEQGLEPIAYAADRQSKGHWQADSVNLPPLAEWDVRIDVLVSDFDRARLHTTL